jgi:hypothetical protein
MADLRLPRASRAERQGCLFGRRPARSLFARGIANGAFPCCRFDLLRQSGPYLRHLQHDRFGLRIRRSARDLQASRRKQAILLSPPHAVEPCRRLHRERDRAANVPQRIKFASAMKLLRFRGCVFPVPGGSGRPSVADLRPHALRGSSNTKSHTTFKWLPVSLVIPKFAKSEPQILANFGIGTLAPKCLQDLVAKPHRISLATLRKFDDLFGDGVSFGLIAIVQPKRAAHIRIGACHSGNRFRLESPIFEQAVDGHRSCARLSQVRGLIQ